MRAAAFVDVVRIRSMGWPTIRLFHEYGSATSKPGISGITGTGMSL